MKNVLFLLLFSTVSLAGQTPVDSALVARQIDSLIQVSSNFLDQGDSDKALIAITDADTLAIGRFGRVSTLYADCCLGRGLVHENKRERTVAETWYKKALSIYEASLQKKHPGYIQSLYTLGLFYAYGGELDKAKPFFIEAVSICSKEVTKSNPEYAKSLVNLGTFYAMSGDFIESERLFSEGKSIFESSTEGINHTSYLACLQGSAIVYTYLGDYEKSWALNIEAKNILERTQGKESYGYANILNNMSVSCFDNYEAELLLLDAKEIYKKTLGKEHPKYAETLVNLVNLYIDIGEFEKAERLSLEAASIFRQAYGVESQEYALAFTNVGLVYTSIGKFEKAEEIFRGCISIFENSLGKDHPYYAMGLQNLANLFVKKGEYINAEPLLIESKAIAEKTFGIEHIDFATVLLNLGELYTKQGKYQQAEPLFIQGKVILGKVMGKESLLYSKSLDYQAELYRRMGNISATAFLLREIADLKKSLLIKATRYLSESEMHTYIKTFESSLDRHLSFALATKQSDFIGGSFDNVLFYKGFLLQTSNLIRKQAAWNNDPTGLSAQLRSCYRRLSVIYSLPLTERDSAYIADLEELANRLEKENSRTMAGYGDAIRQPKWQELQSVLKPGEAAIEFVRFKYTNPEPTDSIIYAALLLKQDYKEPKLIPLFEEKSLEALVQRNGAHNDLYVKQLYSLADRGIVIGGKPQKTLYELLWQKLEKELVGTKTIYYSPAGLLHRLNLAAIPFGLDSVLADRYQLIELGSTRQLVIPNEIKPAENDAILFGGIRYETDTTAFEQANWRLDSISIVSRRGLNFAYTDSTLRSGHWNYLPFTEKEVNSVEKILKNNGTATQTLKNYAATEETFKSIGGENKPSPRILHIATHGFFFPDPKEEHKERNLLGNEPVFKISDHPMIRSGLLLAGANHAWETGRPLKPGMEDGILTAYEISQMNLSNTELVVLSACETGLGDIQGNEGVYGLQRAFKIAGAKYLIMSLWQVPDKQTSLLMTTFYKKWLEEKMTIKAAFQAAQKELREAGLDPIQWAGFVLVE